MEAQLCVAVYRPCSWAGTPPSTPKRPTRTDAPRSSHPSRRFQIWRHQGPPGRAHIGFLSTSSPDSPDPSPTRRRAASTKTRCVSSLSQSSPPLPNPSPSSSPSKIEARFFFCSSSQEQSGDSEREGEGPVRLLSRFVFVAQTLGSLPSSRLSIYVCCCGRFWFFFSGFGVNDLCLVDFGMRDANRP